MEKNQKIIAACGNNCAECPRYDAYPFLKTTGQLEETAVLWKKIGYRDKIVSTSELACKGCTEDNSCRYNIVKCTRSRGLNNCGECIEYPCENIKNCFTATDKFKPACQAVCSEEEYLKIKRAFFEKKKNLDRMAFRADRLREDKSGYNFYGWETADVPPISANYRMIKNPRMLYDLLSEIWSIDSCTPRLRDKWSEFNKTVGQCTITAFLAQDIFGGKVYGIKRLGNTFHCYNAVGDCVFDLTSEQFGDEVLDYTNNPEQMRGVHFMSIEKKTRYEYLKAELDRKLCALRQQEK